MRIDIDITEPDVEASKRILEMTGTVSEYSKRVLLNYIKRLEELVDYADSEDTFKADWRSIVFTEVVEDEF